MKRADASTEVLDWKGRDELLIVDYDTSLIELREWFCELLDSSDLEHLHLARGVTTFNYRQKVDEFQNQCDSASATIQPLLENVFQAVVVPLYGEVASKQPTPTFRSHFAVPDDALLEEARDFQTLDHSMFLKKHYFDNYRPGIFHRDKDYGLLNGTVNLWIPMTRVEGTNSLWVGSRSEGGRDAMPVTLDYGQCLFFDGSHRWHGAVWNTSQSTRISFDIRFIPRRHLALTNTPLRER